jgi:hypothetical protein
MVDPEICWRTNSSTAGSAAATEGVSSWRHSHFSVHNFPALILGREGAAWRPSCYRQHTGNLQRLSPLFVKSSPSIDRR